MGRPSYIRPQNNRDRNEAPIVAALHAAGVFVRQLNGPDLPDLLVGLRGRWHLLEVKGELGPRGGSSGRRLRKGQQEFHLIAQQFNLPCAVVRTPEDALRAIGLLPAEDAAAYPFDLSDTPGGT